MPSVRANAHLFSTRSGILHKGKGERHPPYLLREMRTSKTEVVVNAALVCLGLACVSYQAFASVQFDEGYRRRLESVETVEPSMFGLMKDTSNRSWNSFKYNFRSFAWILISYTLISCYLRSRLRPQVWSAACSALSVLSLFYFFGWKGACIILSVIAIHLLTFLLRPTRSSVWCTHLILSLLTNATGVIHFLYNSVNPNVFDTFYASVAFIGVKTLMLFVDLVEEKSISRLRVFSALQYILYPANVVFGPIVAYSKFYEGVLKPDFMPLKEILWRSVRLVTWFLLMEILLFIPANAVLTTYRYVTPTRNRSAIIGFLYHHGNDFYLLYVLAYGCPYVLGRADGFNVPDWPSCITHIFSYAEMWRVFDRGLYDFISLYLYRPVVGITKTLPRRIMASAVCFFYVIAFHGITASIIVWVTLNFIQIIVEMSAIQFYYYSESSLKLRACLNPAWTRRIVSLLGAASFLLSIFAFSSFNIGIETTIDVFTNTFSLRRCLVLYVFTYCGVQTAIECRVRRLT